MTGLPDWLEPLPDAAAQRALDAWAIEQRRIPGLELMERAGRGLAELVARHVPQGVIAIVCGRGNNGGDGFVAARLLRELGREVDVQLLGRRPRELSGDARANCERLPGAPPRPFNPGSLIEVAGIVDAVLGTGSRGAPRGEALDAVETMAAAAERGVPVVACDVPSGVDASTGEVAGPAVRAVATATFHAAKPGLWIAPGKQHAGEVAVVEIGIPADGRPAEGGAAIGLIGDGVLDGLPRARRGGDEVRRRQRARVRRLARADGRAVDGGRGGGARGRRLRDGARAGVAEPRLRAARRGGDERAAGGRRRRARAGGGRRGARALRARRRARARPGARPRGRRRGVRARAGGCTRRCRCCSTPTGSTRTRRRGARALAGAHARRRS